MSGAASPGLGWFAIVRLGLVQSAIGAMVMVSTSLLNRVMVVEYAMAAAIPGGLVAWHYAVQLTRPAWGHGSDGGRARTPWIVTGLAILALGSLLAAWAATQMAETPARAITIAILAYAMIGGGVGAAGTSLLAVLATHVEPARRPAAAALTWIMMIVGIVMSAAIAGQLLDPFGPARLLLVTCGVVGTAFTVASIAVLGIERADRAERQSDATPFKQALTAVMNDAEARRFTVFVFVSMLAYSMQDLILEPFVGLTFGFTAGQTTSLSSVQHMGVLAGMIVVGVGGSAFGAVPGDLRRWTVGGCVASAIALLGLGLAARFAPAWPITANVAILGFANGVFAVAAIGSMMTLAGAAGPGREGVRMGVWGAAQAIAFGAGGLTGALGVDALRLFVPQSQAFAAVFTIESGLFVIAAVVAAGAVSASRSRFKEATA